MPINRYDLASQALVLVGHRPIASFDGPSSGEIAAATLYEGTTADLLGLHRWTFNKQAVQLTRLADAPVTEWDAAYQLPADVDVIYAVQVRGCDIEFDRYGDEIHCDAAETDTVVLIKSRGATEAAWPSYFITAARLLLASVFAIPVAENEQKAALYEGKFTRALTQAKLLDSQGRTAAKMPVGALRRYHGGRP